MSYSYQSCFFSFKCEIATFVFCSYPQMGTPYCPSPNMSLSRKLDHSSAGVCRALFAPLLNALNEFMLSKVKNDESSSYPYPYVFSVLVALKFVSCGVAESVWSRPTDVLLMPLLEFGR